MVRIPSTDRQELVVILDRLSHALADVCDCLKRECEDEVPIWSDEEHLYLEAVVSPLHGKSIDICIQSGRLYLTTQ